METNQTSGTTLIYDSLIVLSCFLNTASALSSRPDGNECESSCTTPTEENGYDLNSDALDSTSTSASCDGDLETDTSTVDFNESVTGNFFSEI